MFSPLIALLLAADPLPAVAVEAPADPKATKIVLIAGSTTMKPGEHAYVSGCAVLMDLLKQTPGVAPVLALDWPKKPETLADAKAIVCLFDGAEKHQFLKENRFAEVQKLADAGVGVVQFHQCIDVPKEFGDRQRDLIGAAWEKGHSLRAHWVAEMKDFPDHPVCRGVTPFPIDDGWLTKLRFVPNMKGVTPLLRTADPKKPTPTTAEEPIVGWAYERAKGRSFAFTGCHLHSSFAQEGYRRFLVNGILWAAGVEVPKGGALVALDAEALPRYLVTPPSPKAPPATPKPAKKS